MSYIGLPAYPSPGPSSRDVPRHSAALLVPGVPGSLASIPDQEDLAGEVHFWLGWGVVVFAGLHALAALKHHFIDRDATLSRMLGRTGH